MATLMVWEDRTTCSVCGETAEVTATTHACGAAFSSILNKRGPIEEDRVAQMRSDLPLVQVPEVYSTND